MGKVKIRPSDKLFSLFIRSRDGWNCQRCSKHYEPPTMALHCSHFQGRGKEATRFDPLNADALCYGCHQYFTSHPADHFNWQTERKGKKVIEALILRSNTYKKRDDKTEKKYWKDKINEQQL